MALNSISVAALGPAQVLAPDPIEHAAFLFSHGVIHRYARMKWLNDLRMTLHDPAWFGGDWSALMERAGHMRVQRSVVATALLVERLDGTPPPPPVAALATAKARRLAAALHREIEADGPKLTDPGPPTTARAMAAAFWRRYGSADSSGLGAYLRILLTSTSAELNRTDLSRPMESAYYAARIRTLLKIAFRGRQ